MCLHKIAETILENLEFSIVTFLVNKLIYHSKFHEDLKTATLSTQKMFR